MGKSFKDRLSMLAFCLFCALPLSATETISIQGRISEPAGQPVTSTHTFRIEFFDHENAGVRLGDSIEGQVVCSERGFFNLKLAPPEVALAADEAWMAIYVDTNDDGLNSADLFASRIELTAVPFALHVEQAESVDWQDIDQVPPGFADGVDSDYGKLGIYNVKEFGAVGNGSHDDTSAIQQSIDQAKTKGGIVYLPPGNYSVSSLDLTDITSGGLTFQGAGVNTTRLLPRANDVHFLDLTGSFFVVLKDFQVGTYVQTVVPKTAILLAQVNTFISNALHFENLYITGRYSVATLYCFGVASSDMLNCDFYNYLDADTTVLFFTKTNSADLTSSYTTLYSGAANCSDWTLMACEIHDYSRNDRTRETVLRLDDTLQMRFIGGNITGNGSHLVLFTGTNQWVTFQGTAFLSDTGTPSVKVFQNEGSVKGLAVDECMVQAQNSIFGGTAGCVYDEIGFRCKASESQGFASQLFDCEEGSLTNSIVHCDGLNLTLQSISASLLVRPGTIEADYDNSIKLTP